MKRFGFYYLIVLSSLIFIACDKDEDPQYFTVVGTVSKTVDSTIIVTDTDERLLVNNSGSAGSLDNDDRVIIYFTVLDVTLPQGIDYVVDLYDVTKVLYKPVIELTNEIADSIGNDPLVVRDIWIAKKYLNMNFSYYGNNMTHYVNLTRTPGTITNDTIDLEVRHNANDDQQAYTINGFVSFDIESLQQEALDSVVLRVKAKEYDGHQYDQYFVYRY
jgi:hypothetical protein